MRTDGSELSLPDKAELISDNGVSQVYRGHDGYIYKRSIPFLIENELYMLKVMWHTGFVPQVTRYDKYTLKITDLGKNEPITDKRKFTSDMRLFQAHLEAVGIRHGDLTRYAVIVKNNKPYIIDWAESRTWTDPRPDKRTEGDKYWIERTIRELTA